MMDMIWPFSQSSKREQMREARHHEQAEMEDNTRIVSEKARELRRVLAEITERRRGTNHGN